MLVFIGESPKPGKSIEYNNAKNVFKNPKSDYTKKLISSVI